MFPDNVGTKIRNLEKPEGVRKDEQKFKPICTRIKNRVVITLFFFLLRKNGRIEKEVAKLIRLQQQSMSEG